MKYSLCILAALISTALFVVEAKRKPHENSKKFDGDFEFAGEVRVGVGRNNAKGKLLTSPVEEFFLLPKLSMHKLHNQQKLNFHLHLRSIWWYWIILKTIKYLCEWFSIVILERKVQSAAQGIAVGKEKMDSRSVEWVCCCFYDFWKLTIILPSSR